MPLSRLLLAFQDFNGVFGVTMNVWLLGLIVTEKEFNDQGYKTIMTIITSYNIYYSVLHTYLRMEFIVDSYGFIEYSSRMVTKGYYYGFFASLLYIHAFTCSVLLLALHCLYRYVKITGQWSFLFDTKKGLLMIFMSGCTLSALWTIICHFAYKPTDLRSATLTAELPPPYDQLNISEFGYMGSIYWYKTPNGEKEIFWMVILGSLGVSTLLGTVYLIVCATGFKLYFFVARSTSSAQSKRMQTELLKMLLAQTIVPTICEYLVCCTVIWGPFLEALGLPIAVFARFGPLSISQYPVTEAFLVIFMFKNYRRRFLQAIPCFRCLPSQSDTVFSISEQPSPMATIKPSSNT